MSVKTIDYAANLAASTIRGPSQSIWYDCPQEDMLQDFGNGVYFQDDFEMTGAFVTGGVTNVSMGKWGVFTDNGVVIAVDPQQDGGVLGINNGSTTAAGLTMAGSAGAYRMVSAATNNPLIPQKLWFECRVALDSITTAQRDVFIGLADNTTANLTTAANKVINSTTNTLSTVPNLFGFHFRSTTNPTDVGLAFNVAGGTVQYPTNLQTLSLTVAGAAMTAYTAGAAGALATGFIKLGFKYDPTAGNVAQFITSASSGQTAGNLRQPTIQVFVNGQPAPAFLTTKDNISVSTFPTGWMTPVIAYKSRSTTTVNLNVDWIRVAQTANT